MSNLTFPLHSGNDKKVERLFYATVHSLMVARIDCRICGPRLNVLIRVALWSLRTHSAMLFLFPVYPQFSFRTHSAMLFLFPVYPQFSFHTHSALVYPYRSIPIVHWYSYFLSTHNSTFLLFRVRQNWYSPTVQYP